MRWKLWSGRRDRLALALLGVLVLGVGLSFMSLLTTSVNGTVLKAYSQSWRTPYDIIVHVASATGARLSGVVDPNVLSTLPSGITAEELTAVKKVSGVTVAAPVAVVGDVGFGPTVSVPPVDTDDQQRRLLNTPKNAGVYRYDQTISITGSYESESFSKSGTIGILDDGGQLPEWAPPDLGHIGEGKTGIRLDPLLPAPDAPALVVGVDPAAETALLGLSHTVVSGSYFRSLGSPTCAAKKGWTCDVPVLVNANALKRWRSTYTITQIGPKQQRGSVVFERNLSGLDLVGRLQHEYGDARRYGIIAYPVLGRPMPLDVAHANSPFVKRWPNALALSAVDPHSFEKRLKQTVYVEPERLFGVFYKQETHDLSGTFRGFTATPVPVCRNGQNCQGVSINFNIIGYYDPSKIEATNAASRLPLMTYRPATAKLVLDDQGRPLNPPEIIRGGLTPTGFLTSPPVLLTTVDAAEALLGDGVINAIRVRIKDDSNLTPETVARAKRIAEEIEDKTGLVAEVTMGSSPEDVLIHVPASNGHPALGWVEEQWVHLDAPVTAVEQTSFGYSAFIALGLLVTMLYAMATGLAGVAARRRELGIAAAVGWPGRALGGMALSEQLIFALAVALVASLVAAYGGAPPTTIGITFLAGLVVYFPAMLVARRAAARVSPGDALRWGDTAPGKRVLRGAGVVPLAVSGLSGRPGRTLLTLVAIALPTALILVLAFVSQHLKGILYTTVTGQYAALQAGPIQYAMGLIALGIAAVTAFDLIRQNAIDHRNERSLLYALGWSRGWIARTMLVEGAVIGLGAGILGDLLGVGAVAGLYRAGVVGAWQTAAWVWLVPLGLGVLTGAISAVVEMRSWNRAGLVGVGGGEVMRGGRRTGVAVVGVALVMVAALLVVVVPKVSQDLRHESVIGKSAGPTAAERAAAQKVTTLKSAVALQEKAVAAGDMDAFLATIDPNAPAFKMEQRHWLEDEGAWKQVHPKGAYSESAGNVSILGGNTARVQLSWKADPKGGGDKAVGVTLNTIWVQGPDGSWLEHGLDHEVYQSGGVTVWYMGGVSNGAARNAAEAAQAVLDGIRSNLEWNADTPLTLEIWPNEALSMLQATIGPHVAPLKGAAPWVGFGEPIRMTRSQATSPVLLDYVLGQHFALQASHNHASQWLAEGLGRLAMVEAGGAAQAPYLQTLRESGTISLDANAAIHPLATGPSQPSDAQIGQWSATSLLFSEYLQQTFGRDILQQVLVPLATEQPDVRGLGPGMYSARNEATKRAIMLVTGKTWAQLNSGYMAWVKALPDSGQR